MTGEKKEKAIEVLSKLQDKLEGYYEQLDDLCIGCDRPFSEAMDELQMAQPEGKKLNKKEKKVMMAKILNEKVPEFVKILNEFDLMMEAIKDRIETTKDKLQGKLDAMEEIEQLQEEIEDKKRDLDI
jgi:hypothetical protein